LAHLAESFGVRTAWHGPGDLSPIGHAAHMHLGAITSNFGIQEVYLHGENSEKVFKGIPEISDGNRLINDRPGFGIDMDFDAALEFPFPEHPFNGAWPEIRRTDGTIIRP
jgi:mannonate dehydratase